MRLYLLLLLMLTGCAAPRPPSPQRPATIPLRPVATRTELILSPDIVDGADSWLREARKRFKDPYIVYCHGGPDLYTGQWWLSPSRDCREFATTESIAVILHALMPDRDIIFVTCDECGSSLPVPRCWHSRRVVSSIPQAYCWLPLPREWCGSIREFVCDAP